jgi:pimeloyl-ACP methyl ester carboxylesterase
MTRTTATTRHTPSGAYADVNGLKVYYEVHGTGRPLVLLHGGVLTIDLSFGTTITALAESHQVIAIELQGHGHTADTDREMSLDVLADDVVLLLGQLGITQADFYGFSLGGLVSLTVALERPELVGRLVLASVHYRPDGYHHEIWEPDGEVGSTRLPTEADFRVMHNAYVSVAPDPAHFEVFMAKTSGMVRESAGWSPEDLRALAAPTMVMVGDHDFVRLEHAIEMFELIPDAQLAVLPGTTHIGVTQDAARVLALIEPFLARPS